MIYLAKYRTHQSAEELEKSVTEHIQMHYNKLTEADRKVLVCLREYGKLHLGACHVKADTIATNTSTSRSTVMRSLKKLVSLGIIEKVNRTKLNGIKGASIYKIMHPCDTSSVEHRDTTEKPPQVNDCEEQNGAEYIKSFNLFSFKTSTLQEIYNIAHADKDFMSDWQRMLLELLTSIGIDEILDGELSKLILATEINDASAFHMAKEVIVNLAKDLQSGQLSPQTTLRAIYKGAYNKRIERKQKQVVAPVQVQEKPQIDRSVIFYNWLDEREVSQ